MKVTSSELRRHFGRYLEVAQQGPVFVTRKGREQVVLLSAQEYRRLRLRERQALPVEALSDADLEAIGRAEVPTQFHGPEDGPADT
jgi:prevent-host-death family protein